MNRNPSPASPARRLVLSLAAALAAVGAAPALAADYPTKPITLVVPFAAGGPTDVLARVIAERMARDLGQPIVIENTPGAGGTVGNARVARARPDGYTLLIGNVGTLATSGAFYNALSYDVLTDFQAIASVGDAPQIVSARKDFPASGLDALAAYVKPRQDTIHFGTAGVGSGSFLGGALLNAALDLKVDAVNYRGAGQALTDVVAGHIDYMVDSSTTSVAYVLSGKVKGVAVLRPARIKMLPDVPAAGESQRYKDVNYDIWNMMVAPRATPPDIVNRLNRAARTALADTEVLARLASSGIETPSASHQSPDGAQALLRSEVDRWRPLVKALRVTLD